MPVTLFIRGFLIGLSVAAAIGPMAILCIRRTLAQGHLAGLATGLGVASADGCYGAVAGFGLVLISQFVVAQHVWLRLIGGIFLCYLGLKTLLAAPATRAASAGGGDLVRSYLSALGLTLTNPMTILSFAAIFAGLGVGTGGGYGGAGLLVLGVFIGSALWWVVLAGAVTALRGRITPRVLRWVNRASGTIILAFGLVALASLG
ncbi:MAG TPA: LysE family transporter [Chloroflexota bacterium]|nr:LysE family transporter [Chloroflexota bacterium]